MSSPTRAAAILGSHATGDAAEALQRDRLVGFPTETVYGVAAWAHSDAAIRRLRELKVGGRDEAFTVHAADLEHADPVLSRAPAAARRLARRAMPGPLTLRIELGPDAAAEACRDWGLTRAAQQSAVTRDGVISLRIPADATAVEMLRRVDPPVVAAAARVTRRVAAVDAEAAAEELGEAVDMVLDGGRSRYAKASTVVRFFADGAGVGAVGAGEGMGVSRYRVEREGIFDRRMIEKMTRLTVLFVCSGNTCRSPMAEALARAMLTPADGATGDEARPEVRVMSAGVMAVPGAPASEAAVRAAAGRGGELRDHRSQPLTRELVSQADVIFTMTAAHRDAVLEAWPEAAEKTLRLDADRDVGDPVGAGDAVYEQTAETIHAALRRRLEEGWITP